MILYVDVVLWTLPVTEIVHVPGIHTWRLTGQHWIVRPVGVMAITVHMSKWTHTLPMQTSLKMPPITNAVESMNGCKDEALHMRTRARQSSDAMRMQ